ncbi:ubiquitin-ribosomal protein eL40 fusion protein [Battus philenor]|uniref:ubiquitin-ribosomal protein eL40 fusion protein n=1 Tax=Battus philenor TaxID=42288 RepID=UPI0035CED2CE
MKIIIKKLQGGEFVLDVLPTTTIIDIKKKIFRQLKIPVDQQKLLLLGRALADDKTVSFYPNIKEDTKLNLVVKKPEGLYEVSVKLFKRRGMNDLEAASSADRVLQVIKEKFYKMSWDDVDKLCYDCLLDERGVRRPPVDKDNDCDDL